MNKFGVIISILIILSSGIECKELEELKSADDWYVDWSKYLEIDWEHWENSSIIQLGEGLLNGLFQDDWESLKSCIQHGENIWGDIVDLWDSLWDLDWKMAITVIAKLFTVDGIMDCISGGIFEKVVAFVMDFNFVTMLLNIGSNLLSHGLSIGWDLIALVKNVGLLDWYNVGFDIGEILGYLLL